MRMVRATEAAAAAAGSSEEEGSSSSDSEDSLENFGSERGRNRAEEESQEERENVRGKQSRVCERIAKKIERSQTDGARGEEERLERRWIKRERRS